MPNRILREGILSSEGVAELAWPAEVFYRRLMSVVDDFGRYFAKPELLRSAAYPLQHDKVGNADIGKWLTECVRAGLVSTYAVAGKEYLEVAKFRQQVRAKESRFPAPPSECVASAQQPLANEHLDVSVSVSVSEGGDDISRGKRAATDKMAGFAEFYAAYPKKVARQDAEKAWKKLAPSLELQAVMAEALEAQKQSRQWSDPQYIPHPATWLNDKRWQDEVSRGTALPQQTRAVEEWLEGCATIVDGEARSA